MSDAPKISFTNRPYAMALGLVFQMGFIIAIPVFVLGLGGAYADSRMGSSPYLLLLGFALAAYISTKMIRAKVRAIMADYHKQFPPRKPGASSLFPPQA